MDEINEPTVEMPAAEGPAPEKKISVNLGKTRLLTIFLLVLLFMGAVQSVQLAGMLGTLSEQQAQIDGLKESGINLSGSSNTGSGSNLPSNLQNLPSMVGGC